MYYDKKKRENAKSLVNYVNEGADMDGFAAILIGMLVEATYDIANELHELNKKTNAEVDDGR